MVRAKRKKHQNVPACRMNHSVPTNKSQTTVVIQKVDFMRKVFFIQVLRKNQANCTVFV